MNYLDQTTTHENKTALITGISGQDGSYLAEFLIQKNYSVHGIMRENSTNKFKSTKSGICSYAALYSAR